MRQLRLALAVALSAAVIACSSSKSSGGGGGGGITQPAGTVVVNFTVNDPNHVFAAGDLQWKGSYTYDATTRVATYDSSWGGGNGPFATLYDDGPWTAGGHEPEGATAGDHKWGVAIFAKLPETGSNTWGYGLNDAHACAAGNPAVEACNGWIWKGDNGTFTVTAGNTTPITAPGLTFGSFGTTDLELTLDKNALDTSTSWDTSKVTVKGSAWGWSEIKLTDDGTGKFTFVESEYVGAGKALPHAGLVAPGDKPEFIFVLNGVEYKDAGGVALPTGVTASIKPAGETVWSAQPIEIGTNNNTYITVPTPFVQPTGTVAVNFTVVDPNHVFSAGDLQWKGSYTYAATTRVGTYDASWGGGNGPYANLYDDGPWSVGGHEPSGSTAGDHRWGVTVFFHPPATGSDAYGYGLNDAGACDMTNPAVYACNGWIWKGDNGAFTIAANATAPINAPGLTFGSFGTNDMELVLDTTLLDTSASWDTSRVTVKGSAWGWSEIKLTDDGTGKYVFDLSQYVGAGNALPHSGLTSSGDKPEFIFVLTGVEYKDAGGIALEAGVTAGTKAAGDLVWTPATIAIATNNNTYITIP